MEPAKMTIAGEGLAVSKTDGHPAGILYSGGYDAKRNELYLSSVMGHPRGVLLASGDPSNESISGMRVILIGEKDVYWATDSMSLPRGLTENESIAVQLCLECYFNNCKIHRVERFENIQN